MKTPANPFSKASTLLAALMLASLAVPAAADHDRDGVTLFQHVHFGGQYQTFHGDVPNLRRTFFGNDCASSITVPRGCQVTLYRDAYFRGPAITTGHDLADLRYTRVGNDEISSLSVSCYDGRRGGRWNRGERYEDRKYDGRRYDDQPYEDRRYDDQPYEDRRYDDRRYDDQPYDGDRDRRFRGVTVYSDAGFGGRYESFEYDDADLRDNPILQDTISSIEVAPGCRAVLYTDVGFRGTAMVLTESYDDLRYSAVGNDRISSIRVDCRGR